MRFEESGRRTNADTQKTLPYIENEKKKAQEMRKKAMEKIWRDESDTGNRNKVKRIVQKLLVFFEKNLNKIANLYRKICKKKKAMKETLGKDSIISSLYKISKCKFSKARQFKSFNNSRLDFAFVGAKAVK